MKPMEFGHRPCPLSALFLILSLLLTGSNIGVAVVIVTIFVCLLFLSFLVLIFLSLMEFTAVARLLRSVSCRSKSVLWDIDICGHSIVVRLYLQIVNFGTHMEWAWGPTSSHLRRDLAQMERWGNFPGSPCYVRH